MAEIGYLASALVTGGVLLAVWTLLVRQANWRSYGPETLGSTGGWGGRLNSPATWSAGFVLLTFVVGGSAVLFVSDHALAASVGGWLLTAATFGVLLVGFALWGTYSSARHRGHHSARAAMLSAWVLGSLFVTVVAMKLLVAG